MSENKTFKPEFVSTPKSEELNQLTQRIKIEPGWDTRKNRAVTSEYLQTLSARLTDNTQLTGDEWDKMKRYIYGTINISEQPEAKKLWDIFLERGIDDLSHLIQQTSIEVIQKEAEVWLTEKKYPADAFQEESQKLLEYWINGEKYALWFHEITRMLDYAAGTSEKTVIRLGQKMIKEICVPYGKRMKEIDPEGQNRAESEIAEVARCIEYARETLGEATSADREERIKKVINEVASKI